MLYIIIIIINGTTARLGPWLPLLVFVMVRYVRYEVMLCIYVHFLS
jgi:hypothetical protein